MSRILRGAVIGYGFIASKGHVPAYQERARSKQDVRIVAIADPCEARRTQAQRDLPDVRVYSDAAGLLSREAPQLDFVDICTPPSDHARLALQALERGLHVLCEKPLTSTVEEARSVLIHALKAGRVIFPCHNYKHAPVVVAIRKVLSSGQIGRVRSVVLNTFRNTHAKGVSEWRPDWRRDVRFSGGGIAMDHGSHSFYLIFEWMKDYPTAVSAKMMSLGSSHDTEDNFSAVLTFPHGMAQAYLCWTAGVRKVIYSIQGEKGAITVEDDDLKLDQMIQSCPEGKTEWKTEVRSISSHWMDASHVSWFNSLFDQFKEAILKDEFVGKEAQEAFLCVQLINAAYQSARDGCREISLKTRLQLKASA